MESAEIDRQESARRIERDIEVLSGRPYTRSSGSISRYAYTPEYARTIGHFARQLRGLGFETYEDPIGNFVARNRPRGEPTFGLGSHCDSNRNGGKYDGTMGVAAAVEVCRLNEQLGAGLPLQVISFLEEEGSGFSRLLLGSRVAAGLVTEKELCREIRAVDDGRTFFEHAVEAGHEPSRWRESAHILDNLYGWIELHIEQGRILETSGHRIGVVSAIAGYVHAELSIRGLADHAGATPMASRHDAGLVAAECMLEVERLAAEAGDGTVATVGQLDLRPGLINAVPGEARFTLDVRGVDDGTFRGLAREVAIFARRAARRRGAEAEYSERQAVPAAKLDGGIVAALCAAADACGEPWLKMRSGAAHDTMNVALRVPSAMVFVPCEEGISHSPLEKADPADAALGAEVMLRTIRAVSPPRCPTGPPTVEDPGG
jgi:hydantoinase/carbamoylase family amidase